MGAGRPVLRYAVAMLFTCRSHDDATPSICFTIRPSAPDISAINRLTADRIACMHAMTGERDTKAPKGEEIAWCWSCTASFALHTRLLKSKMKSKG